MPSRWRILKGTNSTSTEFSTFTTAAMPDGLDGCNDTCTPTTVAHGEETKAYRPNFRKKLSAFHRGGSRSFATWSIIRRTMSMN